LTSFLKKIVFWNYPRNTWQWDVLCVLILIFIFLTPKGWFTSSERRVSLAHPKPTSTLRVNSEVVEKEADKAAIQQRVRLLTGRPDVEVINIRKAFDNTGRPQGYEVDIR
jgi:hypothetical protein